MHHGQRHAADETVSVNTTFLNVSDPQRIFSIAEGGAVRAAPSDAWTRSAVLDELRGIKAELDRKSEAILVPITTLAPEPYELIRDILAVVRPADDEFIATFFDANISTSATHRRRRWLTSGASLLTRSSI